MAKGKLRNIDTLASELKNKFNCFDNKTLKIGVIVCADSFEEGSHALTLGNAVKNQVLKNGCESEIVCLPSLNERFRIFSSNNYVLPAFKNQVANMLELVNSEKNFDGVVFIPNGFSATVGCLISSIRLNLPTLVLPVGLSNRTQGNNLLDVLSLPGKIANNYKSVYDLEDSLNAFSEYAGSGATFNSENLFNIILEVMELVPKNSSTTNAQSFVKLSQAKEIANHIVELTKNRLPLKKMINRKSVNNALALNFCLGGNPTITNALCELATEADFELDFNKVLAQGKSTPVLFNTFQGLNTYLNYGGTWALIKAMIKEKIIDGNYKTFADTTLSDETKNIKDCEGFSTVIKKESIVTLRGNVAERFAILKTICLPEDKQKVSSKVKVFDSDEEACNAVLNKVVVDGDVIVIKESGKNTQTGSSIICQTAVAIKSMELDIVLITDGFVAEDINIVTLSCVSPDSNGGNIQLLKDGDSIEIDFAKLKVNVDVNAREFNIRQKKYIKENKILPKYLKN